jgi:hypothetical protein
MSRPTVERLHAAFTYDPATGVFRKKATGQQIGFRHFEYVVLGYDRKKLRAHRVAWAMTYGAWPERDIDHVNRNGTDNRLENLRLATPSQNTANTVRRNSIGRRGVRIMKGKYQANIKIGQKQKNLGTYGTIDEAAHAYNKAAIQIYGEFAILNPIGEGRIAAQGPADQGAKAGAERGGA